MFAPEAHRITVAEVLASLDIAFTPEEAAARAETEAEEQRLLSLQEELDAVQLADEDVSHSASWSHDTSTLMYETATDLDQTDSDLLVVHRDVHGAMDVVVPITHHHHHHARRVSSTDVDLGAYMGLPRAPYSATRAARRSGLACKQ